MRTSEEPNKLYIVRKLLMRANQKCNFLLNLSHCVKSYGHLCQIYHNNSPNMVTLPWLQIPKFFNLLPNSILNFRKRYQIWGNLTQEQKRCRQKTN